MSATTGFTRQEVFRIFAQRNLQPPSHKQLQYWATTGLIQVEMANKRLPIYDFQTILDVMVICRLLDGGVSLQRIRKSLEFLERECGWRTEHPTLESFELLTDGQDIYKVEPGVKGHKLVMSLLKRPGQLGWRAFVLPTQEIVEETARIIVLNDWREKLSEQERLIYKIA